MSREVQVRFCESRGVRFPPATHLVVLCHTQAQADQVKARLAEWLEPRGLAFNEGKTTVVPVTSGFDFLGFTIRRYPNGKLLTTPSKAAIRRIKGRLRAEVRYLWSAKTGAVPYAINPIVRGWAAYYRHGVSKRVFTELDAHVWELTWQWAKRRHPKKPKRWIVDQYYGQFNRGRQDRWIFGDRDGGLFLHKFAWTRIVRHEMVKGAASTDDPTLTDYWAGRRRRKPPPLDRDTLRLLQHQQGRCPRCGRLPPARRPRATIPRTMGTMAHRHPQSDSPGNPSRGTAAPADGRYPSPAHRLPQQTTHTAVTAFCTRDTHETCLSRVRGNPHARF